MTGSSVWKYDRSASKVVEIPAPRTESELCDVFSAAAVAAGWSVHPEVAGWDIVLERDSVTVAIEAKLRIGWRALEQASSRRKKRSRRARHTAMLFVWHDEKFRALAEELGVGMYSWIHHVINGHGIDAVGREEADGGLIIPSIPLQGSGGLPSPRKMSKWRENAIRLEAALDLGPVSWHEFERLGVGKNAFLRNQWMEPLMIGGKKVWETWNKKKRMVYARALPVCHGPSNRYEAEKAAIIAAGIGVRNFER